MKINLILFLSVYLVSNFVVKGQISDSVAIEFVKSNFHINSRSLLVKRTFIKKHKEIQISNLSIPFSFYTAFFSGINVVSDSIIIFLKQSKRKASKLIYISAQYLDSFHNADTTFFVKEEIRNLLNDTVSKNELYFKKLKSNLFLLYMHTGNRNHLAFRQRFGLGQYILIYVDEKNEIWYTYHKIQFN